MYCEALLITSAFTGGVLYLVSIIKESFENPDYIRRNPKYEPVPAQLNWELQ